MPPHQRSAPWLPRHVPGTHGSVLLWALGVNAVLLFLAVNFFPFFQTIVQVPRRLYTEQQTMLLADAGVTEAIWEFNYAPQPRFSNGVRGWTQMSASQCAGFGATTCFRKTVANLTTSDGSNQRVGDFRVTVLDPTLLQPIVMVDGFGGSQAAPLSTRRIRATIKPPGEGFRYAFFGGLAVDFAADPSAGSGFWGVDDIDQTVSADIGTNGDGNGTTIDLSLQSGYLDGHTRRRLDASLFLNGVSRGSGNQDLQQGNIPLPPIVVPPALQSAACATDPLFVTSETVEISGDVCFPSVQVMDTGTLVLNPGARLYIHPRDSGADGLVAASGGTIKAQGANVIFLDGGRIELSRNSNGVGGAIVTANTANKAMELQIYQKNFLEHNLISQEQPFFGVVYSESGWLDIKNCTASGCRNMSLQGAFVAGKGLLLRRGGNGSIMMRYDPVLMGTRLDGSGPTLFTVASWQTQMTAPDPPPVTSSPPPTTSPPSTTNPP